MAEVSFRVEYLDSAWGGWRCDSDCPRGVTLKKATDHARNYSRSGWRFRVVNENDGQTVAHYRNGRKSKR